MSNFFHLALVYWAVCIVFSWAWLIVGYVKAAKRGNQIHSRMIWDFLITAIFAPFTAVFVIALLVLDLLDYLTTKYEKK